MFKKDEEKHLYDKINEIRQYFSSTKKRESYDETLKILADAKQTTDDFFKRMMQGLSFLLQCTICLFMR